MERLTKRNPFDGIIELTKEIGEPIAPYNEVIEALSKLAAYEDTGLTPVQVQHWKECITTPTTKHLVEMCEKIEAERDRYKDAEADGRLIVLPCKVGDELWFEKNGKIRCETIDRITVDQTDEDDGWYISIYTMSVSVLPEDIGRLVFRTREEAEAALAKGGDE